MAHFAQIDDSGIVQRVLVVPDEHEDNGQDYLANEIGLGGTWIQTSYNAKIRGNYAGIGFTYLEEFDLFMPPKCHPEAILNSDTAKWDCTNEDHNVAN